jgi:hypothetical protein
MKIKSLKLATSVSLGGVEYQFIDVDKKPITIIYNEEKRKYYLSTEIKSADGKKRTDFIWVHETNVQWARPVAEETQAEMKLDKVPRRASAAGKDQATETL